MYDATWKIGKFGFTDVCSIQNSWKADQLAGKQVWLRGAITVFRATWIDSTDSSVQSYSFIRICTATDFLRDSIGTGGECHKRTFLSLGNIQQILLQMNDSLNKMSLAKFSSILNHSRTFKSPILTNNGMVSTSNMGFFAAASWRRSCCFLIFNSHSLCEEALLMRLSPAPSVE